MSTKTKLNKVYLEIMKQSDESALIEDIHRIRKELGLPHVPNHLDDLEGLKSKAPQLLARLIEAEHSPAHGIHNAKPRPEHIDAEPRLTEQNNSRLIGWSNLSGLIRMPTKLNALTSNGSRSYQRSQRLHYIYATYNLLRQGINGLAGSA